MNFFSKKKDADLSLVSKISDLEKNVKSCIDEIERQKGEIEQCVSEIKRRNDEIKKQNDEIKRQKTEIEKLCNNSISLATKNELSELEYKVDKSEKISKEKNEKYLKITKELADFANEILEEDEEDENSKQTTDKKAELELINKNFAYLRKKIRTQDEKIEGIMEAFADRISAIEEEEQIPDIFASNMSIRKIFKMKNKNKAMLASIVIMMKKFFEEKGIRV